ncbi:rifin PIR protein, putative [Plasmodium reichenowi]|uniref:Rifin PIR protein, putative n=1 Tax=Plasmodium reichenowi TaxID=5854 RepID=A0A2P9DSX4_PLARE|nr:rifin PIR protein, putative [Plasmodium reichenowi]
MKENNMVYNKNNEPYVTTHHKTIYTSRVLSEGDTQSSNYDNDPQMRKVMNNFNRQTSQRFEEYEERVKEKRQKRKEERDKNIQKIIEKDEMEKSLAQKIEKGCLRCGCGLGGVAASVGIFGAVAVNELIKAALTAALAAAKDAGIVAGKIVGDFHGMNIVIEGLRALNAHKLIPETYKSFVATKSYTQVKELTSSLLEKYNSTCTRVKNSCPVSIERVPNLLEGALEKATKSAKAAADIATNDATEAAIETSKKAIEAASYNSYSAIGYSVLAILIIVLVMIIIYLVLRYRRKKKMKKKSQYTKLLNQ